MDKATESGDGQFVVIQNVQRVTKTTPNQQEAQNEANRLNKLNEGSGQPVPENKRAAVKQNLCG